jgi:hypothetical protein
MATLGKPKDVQDKYRFQVLRDQHGREWGTTIELSTGDPTGPMDPRFKAPLYPPQRFVKVDSRKDYGRANIDYAGWAGAIRQARDHWRKELLDHATAMYGDAAAQKMDETPLPAALAAKVGRPPEPLEPILAAEHGDKWVLGLTTDRPGWADLFFPKATKKRADDLPAELAFLKHGQPQEATTDTSPESYPVMYAPGRWRLSDGSTVRGKKVDALKAQEALAVPSGAVHASWGG